MVWALCPPKYLSIPWYLRHGMFPTSRCGRRRYRSPINESKYLDGEHDMLFQATPHLNLKGRLNFELVFQFHIRGVKTSATTIFNPRLVCFEKNFLIAVSLKSHDTTVFGLCKPRTLLLECTHDLFTVSISNRLPLFGRGQGYLCCFNCCLELPNLDVATR